MQTISIGMPFWLVELEENKRTETFIHKDIFNDLPSNSIIEIRDGSKQIINFSQTNCIFDQEINRLKSIEMELAGSKFIFNPNKSEILISK